MRRYSLRRTLSLTLIAQIDPSTLSASEIQAAMLRQAHLMPTFNRNITTDGETAIPGSSLPKNAPTSHTLGMLLNHF